MPADITPVWRPAPRDLAALLSCRYLRVVAHDNTVRLGPRWVQLPPRRVYTGRRLELRECLDGRLRVFADGACIASQPAPAAAFVLRPRQGPSADRRPPRRAAQNPPAAGGRYPPTGPNRQSASSPRSRPAARRAAPPPRRAAESRPPVAPHRNVRYPQPGDDISSEQLG